MTLLGALLTAFLVVLVVAGALWGLSALEEKRREALEALAARRGWSLNITKQSLGHPAILRLSPKTGPAWQIEVRIYATRSGKPGRSLTQFHAPGTGWDGALLVVGPTMGAEDSDAPNTILRQFDNQIGRSLLRRVVDDDTADQLPDLAAWGPPGGVAIFASCDPASRTDLRDLAKAYADWSAVRRGDSGQPILVLKSDGLRIGLGHGIQNAAKLEGFIDYAIRLNRHFSRP